MSWATALPEQNGLIVGLKSKSNFGPRGNELHWYNVATMTTVASRELKNRLGKYLRLVRHGQPVRITDRGRPIGWILPESSSAERSQALLKALAKGSIRFGSGQLGKKRRPAMMKPGKSIGEMISEDRR